MHTKKFLIPLTVVTAIFSLSSALNADVAFTTFGPGDSFNAGTAYALGFIDAPRPNVHDGFRFTATATGQVSNVELALGLVRDNGVDAIEAFIWSEGSVPGAVIWSATTQEVTSGVSTKA
jgi:hypothetical protein